MKDSMWFWAISAWLTLGWALFATLLPMAVGVYIVLTTGDHSTIVLVLLAYGAGGSARAAEKYWKRSIALRK